MTRERTERRWPLLVGLFLLAPYLGEFLLGNQPITALPWLLALAPMYGGGALLVREVGRRLGGGWPVLVLLAAGYALLEEGPIDQMLFNPGYLGLPSFAGLAPIPGLDISAELVQGSLTLHTIWSICVPIALVEGFATEPLRPWLRRTGLAVTAAIFVLGCTALAFVQYDTYRFVGSGGQFGVVAVAIVLLVASAVLVARRWPGPPRIDPRRRPAPPAVRVGVAAFLVSSGYWAIDTVLSWFLGAWPQLAIWAAYAAGCAVLLVRCSHRAGWGAGHRLAVAGGLLLTYVWYGLVHATDLGTPLPLALAGTIAFGAGAIALLFAAVRAHHRHTAITVVPPE
ncbi:hypothetical protein Athai_17570 [Actinocatenispora thailandica]|uniref:DUF998 domain-containing protein n=1 Tax=Actinocatenispora thailandica TaxID=227318 RepID=A0A7R7DM33_9ACTN|nr:hypothetical protein [Actinocatenispora thailandica]BCJ34254.1 hypothetical protein Athai_17570 [Actinocatenispora thailandica]